MLYSQKQVRDELDITQEAYRYWAKTVPALASRAGKKAKLTFGDVLALAFTRTLCNRFGVRIGAIASAIEDLFVQLNNRSWVGLEGGWLKIAGGTVEFITPSRGQLFTLGEDAIFIECAPVVEAVRTKILATEPDQLRLTFGPKVVDRRR